jgi:two-component system, chemotaxis family, CheB/CheR fusion protein
LIALLTTTEKATSRLSSHAAARAAAAGFSEAIQVDGQPGVRPGSPRGLGFASADCRLWMSDGLRARVRSREQSRRRTRVRGAKMTERDQDKIAEANQGADATPDETPNPDETPKPAARSAPHLPIVAIGASAGGLAAFEAFLSNMPADNGMVFVLVQHLSPDHKSILAELVQRHTPMKAVEVEDGTRVEPNCVYIIPPNRDLAFLDGTLQLMEPSAPHGHRLPIDFLFRSLAMDQREQAICIVLSGTGSDGSQGLRAIKAEGGMVMAQDPDSAEYDGMPRSAIATGQVDYISAPAAMPAQLLAYTARAFGRSRPPPVTRKAEDPLKKIFILLRAQTGHDFSLYKPSTINRRLERRMAVQQIDELASYVRYLQDTPGEIDALFNDLLIGVTNFFRDPETFEALGSQVALLLKSKASDAVVRVWSAGCSTGEEAYSLAILVREQLDALKLGLKLQVFASDIDRRAVDIGRRGVYSTSIAADVSPERLTRWFHLEGGAYRIHQGIRDSMVFSEHDVIKDPPFSKLDLICCRNVLIYLRPELQRRLIPLFHYALNPSGILCLGTSETVGEFHELFAELDRKAKLYQRKQDLYGTSRPALGEFIPPLPRPAAAHSASGKARLEGELALRELTERALLLHAPAGALVNARGDLLYIHGRTGKYLEPAPGQPALNILKMARNGLRSELATALHRATTYKEVVRSSNLRVQTNGDFVTIDVVLRPISTGAADSNDARLYLITFEEVPARQADAALAAPVGTSESRAELDARIAALQHELRAKDEYLQSTQEEMQTANEELQSSNEELQSTNEELQSTNEELETSKEELQSVNEELATVNTELQTKVTDLSRVNNDMNNLLAATDIGTIFVDHDLCIQRFTPAVTKLMNLIRTDVGRPLAHTVSNLTGYDRLIEDVTDVLDTLSPKEVEVETRGGVWYLLRIRPYRTLENVIEGAVITFTDVSELRAAQAVLREAEGLRRMAMVMRDAYDAMTVQDLEGRILAWNQGAVRLYGWSESEALTMNVRELTPEGERERAFEMLKRVRQGEAVEPFTVTRITKAGHLLQILTTSTALVNEVRKVYGVATTEREVAGRHA